MVELPSFFNRNDFFSVLLPGYITIVLYLVLFQPAAIFENKEENQFNLFSVVLLIIAGPAIGGLLRALHRFYYQIRSYFGGARGGIQRKERLKGYAKIRIKCKADQLSELDRQDSEYDFRVSNARRRHGTNNCFYSPVWIFNYSFYIFNSWSSIIGILSSLR
jgi:hypothetical protein